MKKKSQRPDRQLPSVFLVGQTKTLKGWLGAGTQEPLPDYSQYPALPRHIEDIQENRVRYSKNRNPAG